MLSVKRLHKTETASMPIGGFDNIPNAMLLKPDRENGPTDTEGAPQSTVLLRRVHTWYKYCSNIFNKNRIDPPREKRIRPSIIRFH